MTNVIFRVNGFLLQLSLELIYGLEKNNRRTL